MKVHDLGQRREAYVVEEDSDKPSCFKHCRVRDWKIENSLEGYGDVLGDPDIGSLLAKDSLDLQESFQGRVFRTLTFTKNTFRTVSSGGQRAHRTSRITHLALAKISSPSVGIPKPHRKEALLGSHC